ncbi:24040_t:CDS:1, partial [Gigaspora margarita]
GACTAKPGWLPDSPYSNSSNQARSPISGYPSFANKKTYLFFKPQMPPVLPP